MDPGDGVNNIVPFIVWFCGGGVRNTLFVGAVVGSFLDPAVFAPRVIGEVGSLTYFASTCVERMGTGNEAGRSRDGRDEADRTDPLRGAAAEGRTEATGVEGKAALREAEDEDAELALEAETGAEELTDDRRDVDEGAVLMRSKEEDEDPDP
jgi:hypothetical protein